MINEGSALLPSIIINCSVKETVEFPLHFLPSTVQAAVINSDKHGNLILKFYMHFI
jgi:hypothetical protein